MPKYYCDYCDTFLTHDSPSVRKTHCNGRKHKENVRLYYQQWMEEQAQKLIDSTTAAFKAGRLSCPIPPGMLGIMGLPPPNMMLPPPMGMPPGMPMPGMPPGMHPGMPPMMGAPPGMPPGMMPPRPPPGSAPMLPPGANNTNPMMNQPPGMGGNQFNPMMQM